MKTIVIDPFDPDSIDKAIKDLEKFRKERERKIALYVQRLAQAGEVAARKAYGGNVSVKAHKNGDGVWEIRADGEGVVFLEFGAGVYTQPHELAKPLDIDISPGSWSEGPEGMHTWSRWLREQTWSGSYRDYPYNQQPRAAMWEAYKEIVARQKEIADEVFGK